MRVFRREWTQEQLQIQAFLVLLSALKQLWLLRGFLKWSCIASRTSSHVRTKTVHYASGKYVIELEKQYVLNFLTLLLGTSGCRQSCYSTSCRARCSRNSSRKCLCGMSILTMQTDTAGSALIYVSEDGFADNS
jgi:hypothetical protein